MLVAPPLGVGLEYQLSLWGEGGSEKPMPSPKGPLGQSPLSHTSPPGHAPC